MLYYPQLATGAIVQYPLRRSTVTRTVINTLPDGSTIRLADPDARVDRWELRYSGLTDDERTALEQFFRAAEGPLRNFVFLDPDGNLLRWSEDLTNNVWQKDGMISVARAEDVSRVDNQGQVAQGVEQVLTAPGWYRYCFSALVHSNVPTGLKLSLSNSDGQLVSEWTSGAEVQRVWCSGVIAGESDQIRCRFEIQAGASVEIRALQVQAQPMPGAYRRTASGNGVYSARFAQDRIQFQADGVDDHSTSIQIASRPGSQ
jgi:hypothetical protein